MTYHMIGVHMAFDGFRKKIGRKLSVRTYFFLFFLGETSQKGTQL
jgi:hypothetical protein